MSLPKITYVSGGTQTLQFVRGPRNLTADWAGRVNDNLASNGAARERVSEGLDILIAWDMPHMGVGDDIDGWATFLAFALPGGQFKFYPDASLTGAADWFNCVLEDSGWAPRRAAVKRYGTRVTIRVINDAQAPASPAVVLRRLHGLT